MFRHQQNALLHGDILEAWLNYPKAVVKHDVQRQSQYVQVLTECFTLCRHF